MLTNLKIYNDGSHYIGFEPTSSGISPVVYHGVPEMVNILPDSKKISDEEILVRDRSPDVPDWVKICDYLVKNSKEISLERYFEDLCLDSIDFIRSEQRKYILEHMSEHFKRQDMAEIYVSESLKRRYRNLSSRRLRLVRKMNMHKFNYFCTFTYDDSKHNEVSFKAKLSDTFKKFRRRRGWKYIGVWERSPEKKRLHFHGVFDIPDDSIPGDLVYVQDYSITQKKIQISCQNTYFNQRFGRNDFKRIDTKEDLSEVVKYLTKYIEKSGERIVYSRGLPEFLFVEVPEDDVLCNLCCNPLKVVLSDDFNVVSNGIDIGKISEDVVDRLSRKK